MSYDPAFAAKKAARENYSDYTFAPIIGEET